MWNFEKRKRKMETVLLRKGSEVYVIILFYRSFKTENTECRNDLSSKSHHPNLKRICPAVCPLIWQTGTYVVLLLSQPAVAVGNVGQLAVDLMVSTLNMTRVGYIHTDCLIPMAGNNPYVTCKEDAEELHTPAEGIFLSLLELAANLTKITLLKYAISL